MQNLRKIIGAFVFATTMAIIALILADTKSAPKTSLDTNIEALSSGEWDPMNECLNWCITRIDEKCVRYTQYGFEITCTDKRPWL